MSKRAQQLVRRQRIAWMAALLFAMLPGTPVPGQEEGAPEETAAEESAPEGAEKAEGKRPAQEDPEKTEARPLAVVDGRPITREQVLDFLLERHAADLGKEMAEEEILRFELERADLEVTRADVDVERDRMRDTGPNGAPRPEEPGLEDRARLRAAKRLLFVHGNPETPDGDEVNPMLLEFWMRQTLDAWDVRIWHGDPAPGSQDRFVEAVHHGDEVTGVVPLDKARARLKSRLGVREREDALEAMIDLTLAQRALAKAGKAVTDAEVKAWAGAMEARYPPPLDWRVICRLRDTTVQQEKERWRLVQAWKRVTGAEPTDEERTAFRKEHAAYFRGGFLKISHILLRTRDPGTGDPLLAEAREEAEKTARQLARGLQDGADFAVLARVRSEDPVTAQEGGRVTAQVRPWSPRLDPAVVRASLALKRPGDVSPPVRGTEGWYIVRLDERNDGAQKEPDWKDSRYVAWLEETHDACLMQRWLEELRAAANIRRAPR